MPEMPAWLSVRPSPGRCKMVFFCQGEFFLPRAAWLQDLPNMAASTCFKQDFVFSVCEFDCPKNFLKDFVFASSHICEFGFGKSSFFAGGGRRLSKGPSHWRQDRSSNSGFLFFGGASLSSVATRKKGGKRDKDKGKEERTLRFYVPFFFLP